MPSRRSDQIRDGRAARLRRRPVFYGWVLVATAFVTMGIAVNARTAFSLFFPAILDEFGWSRALTAATLTTGLPMRRNGS